MAKKKAASDQLPLAAADAADELAVFRKQDAIIADMSANYMALKIHGVDDRKGFEAVHKARMNVKNTRIEVEKTRERLKESVLERGRKIDGEAKRVKALLEPIEKYLTDQEDAITKEKERLKREAEEAQKAKIEKRYEQLRQCEYSGAGLSAVPFMTDKDFGQMLFMAQADKAQRDREAAEKRKQDEAREAELAAEKKRLADVAKQQAEESERLRVEREKIEAASNPPEPVIGSVLADAVNNYTPPLTPDQPERFLPVTDVSAVLIGQPIIYSRNSVTKAAADLAAHRQAVLRIAEAIQVLSETVPDGPACSLVIEAIAECVERIRDVANGPLPTEPLSLAR